MTCLIQVHDTIHDFPKDTHKDTHAALRANGSSVGAYHVDACPMDAGSVNAGFVNAGFVDVGSVGAGSVGAGSEPAPTGGAGRDNDGTMHRVRHDHERLQYPIRHMVRQVLSGP